VPVLASVGASVMATVFLAASGGVGGVALNRHVAMSAPGRPALTEFSPGSMGVHTVPVEDAAHAQQFLFQSSCHTRSAGGARPHRPRRVGGRRGTDAAALPGARAAGSRRCRVVHRLGAFLPGVGRGSLSIGYLISGRCTTSSTGRRTRSRPPAPRRAHLLPGRGRRCRAPAESGRASARRDASAGWP